jgi:hypothetical protein
MPIDVTCPGCRARFQVREKFAGKKGQCPKCKKVITVPTLEQQVKIHAPEPAGPVDSKGRSVLKPITRTENKYSQTFLLAVGGAVLSVVIAALFIRLGFKQGNKPADIPYLVLAVGAVLLAPPLSWAGYSFLRDEELEAFTGKSLWLRVAITSVAYACLWLVFAVVKTYLLDGKSPQSYEMLYIIPPFVLAGGFAAFGSFDLNYGNGLLHYGLYLMVTVLLRLLMGATPL